MTYTVQSGDSYYRIAQNEISKDTPNWNTKVHERVQELQKLNGNQALHPGQQLRTSSDSVEISQNIQAPAPTPAPAPAPAPPPAAAAPPPAPAPETPQGQPPVATGAPIGGGAEPPLLEEGAGNTLYDFLRQFIINQILEKQGFSPTGADPNSFGILGGSGNANPIFGLLQALLGGNNNGAVARNPFSFNTPGRGGFGNSSSINNLTNASLLAGLNPGLTQNFFGGNFGGSLAATGNIAGMIDGSQFLRHNPAGVLRNLGLA